ncbi:MAG TPA: hypothetical protein VF491_10935 [Vicinamibacterales bacterium]
MPFEAALVFAAVIILVSLIGLITIVAIRRQRAREEEMQRAAAARGWQFESRAEKGYRVHRWTGTTDGVSWRAESLRQSSGRENSRRREAARWHGAWSPGINGAIVCIGLPKGKETPAFAVAQGDGLIAQLAQKAAGFALDKALDAYFGDEAGTEVDAAKLHRVETTTPGFYVMAAEKSEGARIMKEGLEKSLADASRDASSLLSDEKRPWILLRPATLSLGRQTRFRDIDELERFIHTGVALMRTSKFRRTFA